MPNIVRGSPGQNRADVDSVDFSYDYPMGLDLRPGSDLHDDLQNELLRRAQTSHDRVSKRYDTWRTIDRTLTAYIPLDEEEKDIRRVDERKPVSIVFPVSYAMMQTVLSYLGSAFFGDPIFHYEGVEDSDTLGALLLERVIQLQCDKSRAILPLHVMHRDSLAYGVGAVAPTWEVTKRLRRVRKKGSNTSRTIRETTFEGNAFNSVDPYKFMPDPNVSIHEVQKGEFVGWMDSDSYVNLLADEQSSGSDLFNVRYLKLLKNIRSIYSQDDSDRQVQLGGEYEDNTDATHDVDYLEMYVLLIPKDWKLSTSERPEIWMFRLAADEIIITAKPLGLDHEMYPIGVSAPNFDGYSSTSLSEMEILSGMQTTIDALFNTHITNVRKAVNDMLVVDPRLVNVKDLEDPRPGKIIRLKRAAWGRGVKDAVTQLNISDITRANIGDAGFIIQSMQRILPVDDSAMGVLRQGGPERLTGAEFKGTRGGAINRLAFMARLIGAQAYQDLGYIAASHTQQFMTKDAYIRTMGDFQRRLEESYGVTPAGRMAVTPFDISVLVDVAVKDGSIPESSSPESWIDMFGILSKDPELRQEFDMFRIFSHVARILGAKNVEEFRKVTNNIQGNVLPDEQVFNQVEAGNLLPIGGGV